MPANSRNTGKTEAAHAAKAVFVHGSEIWTARPASRVTDAGKTFRKAVTRDANGRFHGSTNFRGTA